MNAYVNSSENGDNYGDYYYNKPYCRVGPYALGIITALVVYSYKQYQNKNMVYDGIALRLGKIFESERLRNILGFLGISLLTFIMFIQYDTIKHPGDNQKYDNWSHAQNDTFIAFSTFTFGLGLSLVLLPVLLGHFSWINYILSLDV